MSSARNFGYSIIEAGPHCVIAKPDIVDAYKKNVPAKISELRYQGFSWLGRYFVELRQMFGAKGAVQNFDVLSNTVKTIALAKSKIPSRLVHRQLDDVPIVGPRSSNWCEEFLDNYKNICKKINLQLASEDKKCDKAFGCTSKGKVLGIYFNTADQTWCLPEDKRSKTKDAISNIRSLSTASTLQIQSLAGRLNFISSMCPFLNSFKFNLNRAVAQAITQGSTKISAQLLDDLKVWDNFIQHSEFWLPIPHEKHEPPIACLNFWTDAAGFPDNAIWTTNIGCEVYGSDINGETILAYQLWWPKNFITKNKDNQDKRFGNKTTTLEMIAILLPFILIPSKLRNCHIRILTDNMACVFGMKDGYTKNDEFASIFIRTMYLLCAYLGSVIHVEHCHRRSSWEASTADNLTREKTTGFLEKQILCHFNHLKLPEPLSSWFANPVNNWQLPIKILNHVMSMTTC